MSSREVGLTLQFVGGGGRGSTAPGLGCRGVNPFQIPPSPLLQTCPRNWQAQLSTAPLGGKRGGSKSFTKKWHRTGSQAGPEHLGDGERGGGSGIRGAPARDRPQVDRVPVPLAWQQPPKTYPILAKPRAGQAWVQLARVICWPHFGTSASPHPVLMHTRWDLGIGDRSGTDLHSSQWPAEGRGGGLV